MIGRLSPLFQRSELYLSVQSHRSHSGVQSHHSHSDVQSHHLHSGVQSHIFILTSELPLFFYLGIQSCIVVLAFRAAWSSWYSEPLLIFVSTFRAITYLDFGVQSHVLFHLAFRAMFCFVRRSESHLRSAFRATSSFDVQSHYIIHSGIQSHVLLCSVFKVTSSFWHSEPLHHSFQ